MAAVYYNDNDPNAAAWLRELMAAGLIPEGDVDERSIEDVRPDELVGYTQCHFFAGIGGWPYALRLAGWPDDWPVWTGSCPCQPYSQAGARGGDDDPRALWWAWRWLIDQCRPPVVFGEQVASADGRRWLAGVRSDLESMGYAVGAADLPAAGVGAPHIRQRLWWVADGRMANTKSQRRDGRQDPSWPAGRGRAEDDGALGNPDGQGLSERESVRRLQPGAGGSPPGEAADIPSPWSDALWVPCADGKARRIKPGLEPLVDGLPGRVALLRGAGNAIVPVLAARFIRAYLEVLKCELST